MAIWTDKPNIIISAVAKLIGLYRQYPKFEKAFEEECAQYQLLTKLYAVIYLEQRQKLSPEQSRPRVSDSAYQAAIGKLNAEISSHEDIKQTRYVKDCPLLMETFINALNNLAWKYSLKLPDNLAGFMLFLNKVSDELISTGINLTNDPSLHLYYPDVVNEMVPRFPDYWEIIEKGQKQTLLNLKGQLANYFDILKKEGLVQTPSELDKHARWWFEHYIKKKKYSDIGNQYTNPESIKRAVFNFSKLIKFKLK